MAAKGKQRADELHSHTSEDEEAHAFRERMLRKLRAGRVSAHRIVTWCPCTGLIAYPAPHLRSRPEQQQRPTASTSILPVLTHSSPSICMTLPSSPSHSEDFPDISFTIDLPEAPGAILRTTGGHEHISHLSFSPDGNYLAVFTSFDSDTIANSTIGKDGSIRFVLFHRGDEINTWIPVFDWDARRAKANLVASGISDMNGPTSTRLDSARVLDVRWLQQGGKGRVQHASQGKKRGHDALLDFSGAITLTAVLQSDELLLVHLPYQAIQLQLYVIPLDATYTATQDLSSFGTSFSPLPVPLPTTSLLPNSGLNAGVLESLGISINGAASASFMQSSSSTTTRLASIGPCSTVQRSYTAPDAPPALVTELLVAFQEAYQPKHLRQTISGHPSANTTIPGDTTGMLLDSLSVGTNASAPQSDQAINGVTQTSQQQQPIDSTMLQSVALSINQNQNFGLPDLQSYGQTNNFETGYGDINLSALDELFDSEFGSGGGAANGIGDNNSNSALGGLSSTLDSINEDFASSFPTATEPDGAPSPTKKDAVGSGNGSGNLENSSVNETQRSDSPSKSMLDGTYGSNSLESRGSSPRKGLGTNGVEDDLPEYTEGMMDGERVEAMSEIKIAQVKIEWTEYGVLNVAINPVSTITSQTPALSLEKAPPSPSVMTHLRFLCNEQNNNSILVAIACPLSEDNSNASSHVQSYLISQESFMLSDAFFSLEGRKSDPDSDLLAQNLEWVVKPTQVESVQRLVEGDRAVLDMWEKAGEIQGLIVDGDGSLRLVQSAHASDAPSKTLVLPTHYPLSVSISPSSQMGIACAVDLYDESQILGKPALFALGSVIPHMKDDGEAETKAMAGESKEEALSQALIHGLIARKSVSDVLLLADRLNPDARIDLLRGAWENASTFLQGAKVEQTRLLWPLLAVQRQLLQNAAVGILDDIMQLSACLRIFQDNKASSRQAAQQNGSQAPVNDIFDGDAIWPIIGHISWMFGLWDRIVTNMTSEDLDRDWSSASFLIMHPLPRMLQQRLVRLIARFANYMMNLREGVPLTSASVDGTAAVLDSELAKTVLGDIIVSQRQKTQEWNNMLQGLTNKLGSEWTDDISKGREALLTLQLPPQLERTAREMAFGMKQKLLPLVDVQEHQWRTPNMHAVPSQGSAVFGGQEE